MTVGLGMYAYLRFARFLLWEFRWALGVFWGIVLLGGLAFYHGYDKPLSFGQACNAVFFLMFAQTNLDYPQEWYLQPLFFVLPVVGIGAIADSMVRLGYLIFARKRNLPEWHRMLASLYHDHVVVVGVGRVGYRIIQGLRALKEPVVAIELNAEAELAQQLRGSNVPILVGNGRNVTLLEQAGVKEARAVILATDDDLANIDAALTAHDMNPKLRVVLRLFDESLAVKFTSHFAMPAIVTSQVSAQAFIAAATGRKVYHDFQLDGSKLHLTDVTVMAEGTLAGRQVGDVQKQYAVNIVMHRGTQGVLINPGHDTVLGAGDTLLVIAPMEHLNALEDANEPPEKGKN